MPSSPSLFKTTKCADSAGFGQRPLSTMSEHAAYIPLEECLKVVSCPRPALKNQTSFLKCPKDWPLSLCPWGKTRLSSTGLAWCTCGWGLILQAVLGPTRDSIGHGDMRTCTLISMCTVQCCCLLPRKEPSAALDGPLRSSLDIFIPHMASWISCPAELSSQQGKHLSSEQHFRCKDKSVLIRWVINIICLFFQVSLI